MKGGSFLILLFLLICFLWGVTAIVGGISRAFSSKREWPASESRPRTGQPMQIQERETEPPALTPSPPAAMGNPEQDDMDHALEQLERISRLRKEGALTEDELAQIKETLIQGIQQK
ncbi:MAG: hypothetical protein LBJ15_24790 [Comamonas sp.]|uniref:hypothetical protein n=1 Tax=Comamonas sp. TaxID=34028 RepID=UPI00281D4290|nr:hypothetical protein [Comamonas sp.]MDR0217202.1 hypothetical protein [Comamonas sp.]